MLTFCHLLMVEESGNALEQYALLKIKDAPSRAEHERFALVGFFENLVKWLLVRLFSCLLAAIERLQEFSDVFFQFPGFHQLLHLSPHHLIDLSFVHYHQDSFVQDLIAAPQEEYEPCQRTFFFQTAIPEKTLMVVQMVLRAWIALVRCLDFYHVTYPDAFSF